MSEFMPKPLFAFMGVITMIGSGYGLIKTDSIPTTILFGLICIVGLILLVCAFLKDEEEPKEIIDLSEAEENE